MSQINKAILNSLKNGDKYGLEIIKSIEETTNGKVKLKQPSLYSALRRMEKKGLINSFWKDSDIGGRRHYYSLTHSGKKELEDLNSNGYTDNDIDELIAEVSKDNSSDNKDVSTKMDKTKLPLNEGKSSTNEQFESFDPTFSGTSKNSFSQQMRKNNEPQKIFDLEKSSQIKTFDVEKNSSINTNLFNKDKNESLASNEVDIKNDYSSLFEDNDKQSNSNKDINYKDILGELDAENVIYEQPSINKYEFLNKTTFNQKNDETYIKQTKNDHKKSDFAKQIEKIITSPNTSNSSSNLPIRNTKNTQNALEQISRRYHLKDEKTNEAKHSPIPTNLNNISELKYIKQDKICINKYSQSNYLQHTSNKIFLNVNKFNICRAAIMSILFIIEVYIAYIIMKNNSYLYPSHEFLYWVSMGFAVVYFTVILTISLQNINKKIRLKDINFASNLLYRILIFVVLITLTIAICLCFGMSNLNDSEYISLWLLPFIAIGNIIISWFVGTLLYISKAFRV